MGTVSDYRILWISSSVSKEKDAREIWRKSPVSGVKLEYVKLKNGIRLRVASAGTLFVL